MSDAALERLALAELGIHVMREEIARMSRMKDDVRLGDGAAQGLPCRARDVVLEKLFLLHFLLPLRVACIFFHKKDFDK